MTPVKQNTYDDSLSSGARFVLGGDHSSRIEIDFFNLYAWLLKYAAGKKVLDVACGSGLGSFILAHKAREVLGLDVSREAIAFATSQYVRENLKFQETDAAQHQYPRQYFEVIVCAMTLEQLEPASQAPLLQKLRDALTDDGLLILVTTNNKINDPFGKKKAGNPVNQHELRKNELVAMFGQTRLDPVAWYGRRRIPSVLTLRPIRALISIVQRLAGTTFGLFGARECPAILPVSLWWQPKDFVVMLRKK